MTSKYLSNVPWNSKRVQEEMERLQKKDCIEIANPRDQETNERIINAFMDIAKSTGMQDTCDINIMKRDGKKLNIEFIESDTQIAEYDLGSNTFKISSGSKNENIPRAWASAFDAYWGSHIDTDAQYQYLIEKIDDVKKSDYDLNPIHKVIESFTPFVNKKLRSKEDMKNMKTTLWRSNKPIIFDNMEYKDYIKVTCTKKNEYNDIPYEATIDIPANAFNIYRERGLNVCAWMPPSSGIKVPSPYGNYRYKSHEPFKKRMDNSIEIYANYIKKVPSFVNIFEAVVLDASKNEYISPKEKITLQEKEMAYHKQNLRKFLSDI